MVRFYLTRIEENPAFNARGPKYFDWRFDPDKDNPDADPVGIVCRWSLMDYGLMDACIVVADVTPEQHDELVTHADVLALPENIDNPIPNAGARNKVRDALELLHIPGAWVQVGITYREVLRTVLQVFQLGQRYAGITRQRLIDIGFTLDNTVGDLPVGVRQNLAATAESFGWDISAITLSWTIRDALKHLADQWGDLPIHFGLVTL